MLYIHLYTQMDACSEQVHSGFYHLCLWAVLFNKLNATLTLDIPDNIVVSDGATKMQHKNLYQTLLNYTMVRTSTIIFEKVYLCQGLTADVTLTLAVA